MSKHRLDGRIGSLISHEVPLRVLLRSPGRPLDADFTHAHSVMVRSRVQRLLSDPGEDQFSSGPAVLDADGLSSPPDQALRLHGSTIFSGSHDTTAVVTTATLSYDVAMAEEGHPPVHGSSVREAGLSSDGGVAELASVAGRRNASGLARDIELIELLSTADAADGMGVSELARQSGRDKGVVSRALATMAAAGLVGRDSSTSRYRIGPRVFALAARTIESSLVATARPILRRMTQATGETSHLCVLREGNVLTVASELSPHEVRTTGWQGVTTAAWRTPSGRALLSDWDSDSLRSWYEMHGHDKAIMSPLDPRMTTSGFSVLASPPRDKMVVEDLQSLLTEMANIRSAGYAILDEELEAGVVGASAPVRDFTGFVIAAINVSAPKARMSRRLDELGKFVARAATALSVRLGAPAQDSRSIPREHDVDPSEA